MFLHLSVSHSVHRGHAWQGGVCGQKGGRGHVWQGGMHGRQECVCQGECMAGGMHGRGGMHGGGACVVGACMAGGMYATHAPPNTTRYGRSMHGRYASYWNAFLFLLILLLYVSDV